MKIKEFRTHQAITLPTGRSFTLLKKGVEFQEAHLDGVVVVMDSETIIPLGNICYIRREDNEPVFKEATGPATSPVKTQRVKPTNS